MNRWFRFYADAIRNPKVARLNDAQFRLWVELLAVASENSGTIPPLDDLKHVLKRRLDHLSRGVKDLLNAGLMDALEVGYEPHNWKKFQYKSDTSTDRVHKHRSKRNVSSAVSETPPDTETEQSIPLPNGNGASVDPEKVMWDSGKAFLLSCGVSASSAGSFLGKCKRDFGTARTIEALGRAKREGAIDPIPFMQKCLRASKAVEASDAIRI